MTEDALKKQLGRYSIYYALLAYSLDDNPQHLWTIWRACRMTGIEVPEVVMSYMDRVAEELDPSSPKHTTEGRIENRIRDAVLGDNRAPKPADTLKHVHLAQMAFRFSPDLTLSEDQIKKLGCQFHKEERTIRRWLKRAKVLVSENDY